MPTLNVKTLDGEIKSIESDEGAVLMEALRDAFLVEATCGGAASCGTCHIYFENSELAGDQTEDEGYMLESLGDFVEIKDGSRLSCQVKTQANHDGALIEIAPEA